ncbi:MAG: Rieske 2Fe-2S domain-containing protein [Hyphomonas sp.]
MPDSQLTLPKTGITADGFLTDSWYLAAASAELKAGTQQRVMLLGEPVMVGRTPAGEAFALRDICPHRLVPLSAGKQIETDGQWTVECPYHGWRFGTDGGCKLMPSLTEATPHDPSKVKVRRYPVHEANGAVCIYIAHDPRSYEPPAMAPPDFGPLPEKPKFIIHDMLNAHMDDAVAGLMDPAELPLVPRMRGWAVERHVPGSSSRLYRWLFGGDVMTEIWFQLPGYRWEIISSARARLVTLTCLTPEAPKRTRITQFTWWTGAPLLSLAVPVTQRKAHQKAMLWADDIDMQAKWYEMLKREWTAARSEGREFTNPIEPRAS